MEVVVVVVVGVLVVVDVVDVGVVGVVVLVPPALGAEEPVPTTVRVAAGVEPPLCVGLPATMAVAEGVGPLPPETCDAAVD
jgi:hypothetical protein